ncbi:ATP synthase subunit K mitochondrial [Pyrenophora seminiperda CCB06]|uniref:ATP synthase subunit K mitochondrial n=1 Tax=Pyrenophora seminiperda CCB06 TaxID=1302712 RepID=A0A3M7MFS4_9PLEO|nr:ATP synthase subunit K mitochondrial [Pyrenophora seminiperda CCB06]
MVAMYNILGRPVGSHVLAMATLGTAFVGAAFKMSGGKKADATTTPPINAKSSDEENFVKEYVKKAADKVQGKQ